MKIAVSENRAVLGKIEQSDIAAWREFNGSFSNVNISADRLLELIRSGSAYTAQHADYRHSKNFIQGQHIALDFDTQDERSTFDHLLKDEFISQYSTFLHTTPSHTEEKPKARVVFILDRPIKDAGKYAELMTALVSRFELSDKACKDAARFFYGAKGCLSHWIGNTLTLEDAARTLIMPFRAKIEAQKAEAAQAAKNRIVTASEDVPGQVLEKHSQSLIDRVSTAPDGEKYTTLRDTAITLGGYVAGGYYSYQDAVNWLQSAIVGNPNNVSDMSHAFATIEESVRYGMGKPLYFQLSKNDSLDNITPPLTQGQKEQVERLINSEKWQSFHDGMTQAQRESWHRYGLPDNLIDYLNLGYTGQQIDPETGEILAENALTIPYRDVNGEVVNIEYRANNTAHYETGISIPYYPDLDLLDAPLVLMPDSITAIQSYLYLGGDTCIAGMPTTPLDPMDIDNMIIVLEPDTKPTITRQMRECGRFVRLPMPVSTMLGYGLNRETFNRYINQARRVA